MKPTIVYSSQSLPMKDLLIEMGVSKKDDLSIDRRESIHTLLEEYLREGISYPIDIDFEKFILQIQCIDEAGHLFPCVAD